MTYTRAWWAMGLAAVLAIGAAACGGDDDDGGNGGDAGEATASGGSTSGGSGGSTSGGSTSGGSGGSTSGGSTSGGSDSGGSDSGGSDSGGSDSGGSAGSDSGGAAGSESGGSAGDTSGGGTGGGDASTMCEAACDQAAALDCPNQDQCVATCEAELAPIAALCPDEVDALGDCAASAPASWTCDDDGDPLLADGVCAEEGIAIFLCMAGGSL